jgi:sporulation protein YlmC with PRC-barrel domain
MKLSELRGKPVVSVAEAVTLGTVDDALVDSTLGTIGALLIASSGGTDRYLVSMDQIRGIGPDVATVSSQHALSSPGQASAPRSRVPLTSIVGSRVVAEDGRVLGTVAEVDFDPSSGRIQALEYGGDGLEGLLSGRHRLDPKRVVRIGPGVLTVMGESSRPPES